MNHVPETVMYSCLDVRMCVCMYVGRQALLYLYQQANIDITFTTSHTVSHT